MQKCIFDSPAIVTASGIHLAIAVLFSLSHSLSCFTFILFQAIVL